MGAATTARSYDPPPVAQVAVGYTILGVVGLLALVGLIGRICELIHSLRTPRPARVRSSSSGRRFTSTELNSMPIVPYDYDLERGMDGNQHPPDGGARGWKKLLHVARCLRSTLPPPHEHQDATQAPVNRQQVCAICISDFVHDEDVRRLPCGHVFHPPCVDPWLLENASTCPLCRANFGSRTGIPVQKPQPVLLGRSRPGQ